MNVDNIATSFTSYDLLNIKENNNLDLNKIKKYLLQNKKMSEIMLEDNLLYVEGDGKMKFDIVVGNPPYQEADGGAQASAKPIYHHFVEISNQLSSRFTSLIIPTRWFVGGKGLDEFRNDMLNDNHLKELHDCLTPDSIFPNTNIRGGVCYFLRDQNYDNINNLVNVITYENNNIVNNIKRPMKFKNKEFFIRDGAAFTIIEKVSCFNFISMAESVSSLRPFGLRGYFSKTENYKNSSEHMKKPVICYAKGRQKGFVEEDNIISRLEWINKWKVFMPRANNIGTELNDDNLNSFIGMPNEICTESYLVVGADL